MAKCDEVRSAWYPGVVKCLSCIRAFLCHNLTPLGVKVLEDSIDYLVGKTKVILVKFLCLNAVDDALNSNVDDCSNAFCRFLVSA